MHEEITSIYRDKFGTGDNLRFFFSPGRVNLIGEHIDYNGGYVLPVAIGIGNVGAIGFREDDLVSFYSDNFEKNGIISTRLSLLEYRPKDRWANYAKGIVLEFKKRGYDISHGFNIAIKGDLPSGAGLSSSASIELLVAIMLNDCFDFKLDRKELALLSQKVENQYIGVNCGIMDQFVIANGKSGKALFLDTSTLFYEEQDVSLGEYDIVVCNTKKRRGLTDSKYNERRMECDKALAFVNNYYQVKDLCSIPFERFYELEAKFDDPVLLKRARHAVTENARVLKASNLLTQKDIAGFASLLNESHRSLKNDYEVSCPELDYMVDLAISFGSIGSRMTGAGFGGSTVNIVKHRDFNDFSVKVKENYLFRFGVIPDILIANPSDGTKEI
ncbi:MAG TPA: galactokinase [Bacillota bacterium]|nr:galactokinase [Bacillota bacterium]HPJ85428.1 galactokinase [Bacillota bacterium]